nr:hypothetical protein [Tanacetum cinerariifolium]
SISINVIPNGDEASTSHNVFNERLKDAYFDASTSFHDPSNVQTFYQPYPHEKKWSKDHPLHKIIGDPKSNVRTRGQLANSCSYNGTISKKEYLNCLQSGTDNRELDGIAIRANSGHLQGGRTLNLEDQGKAAVVVARGRPGSDPVAFNVSDRPDPVQVDFGLSGGRDKLLRHADMFLYSWDGGFDVCVYLTGSSPLTQTGMVDFVPGRAVIEAAQRKRVKYEAKCADIGYDFLSFSFSSFRELEHDAVTLPKRI